MFPVPTRIPVPTSFLRPRRRTQRALVILVVSTALGMAARPAAAQPARDDRRSGGADPAAVTTESPAVGRLAEMVDAEFGPAAAASMFTSTRVASNERSDTMDALARHVAKGTVPSGADGAGRAGRDATAVGGSTGATSVERGTGDGRGGVPLRARAAAKPPAGHAAASAAQGRPALPFGWDAFSGRTTRWVPSAPSLAVVPTQGGDVLLAAANDAFDFFRADGQPIVAGDPMALGAYFATALDAPELADFKVFNPRVVYDPHSRKAVLAAIANNRAAGASLVLVKVFAGDDVTSCAFSIAPDRDGDADLGLMASDLQLSVTRNSLSVAVNLYAWVDNSISGTSGAFDRSRVFFIQRDALLDTSPCSLDAAVGTWEPRLGGSAIESPLLPLDQDRGALTYAAWADPNGGDRIHWWRIETQAGGSPVRTIAAASEAAEPYAPPARVPQLGTGRTLSAGTAALTGGTIADGLLLVVHTTKCAGEGAACLAYAAIDPATGAVRSDGWGIEGGVSYLYPGVVVSPAGLPIVAYGRSGPSEHAGIGYEDLFGDSVFTARPGDGCYHDPGGATWGRWASGSALDVSPATGLTWVHATYAVGGATDCAANGWETRVFAIDWRPDTPPPTATPTARPTVRPTPAPTATPDDGGTKGIGFALASKRYMRGVYGLGGLTPRRGAMSDAAFSGIQVQNMDGRLTARPALTFGAQSVPYDAPGGERFVRQVDMRTIAPGASVNAYLPSLDLLDAMYRVTIVTPRNGGDLGAILRTDWDTGGAAVVSNLWFSERTVIPHVARNAATHASVIALSNAESEPVAVRMRFFRAGSGAVVAEKRIDLGPTEARTFDLNDADADFRRLGDGFVGTAIVEAAGGRVGAQVYEYVESSDLAVGGFEGIPALQASSRLFVPLFRSQQSGPGGIRLNTEIAVANAGDQEAAVTVTYRPTTNESASAECRAAGAVRHGPVRIPASTSHVFRQGPGGGHGLPANCFGSAVVETARSSDAIVATVLDVQNDDETLSMINASPVEFAGTKVALPLFRSRHLVAAFTTGIQVMNTSDRAANVHVDFARSEGSETFPIGGCRGQCDAIIRPFESYTWWPPSVAAIPAGTYGAAVISSDEPIVALVNDYPLDGHSDMATYAGIAVQTNAP